MDRAAVDREYDSLVRQVNSQLTAVSKMVEDQRIEAEKERLRRRSMTRTYKEQLTRWCLKMPRNTTRKMKKEMSRK